MNPKIDIHDAETGQSITREMTDDEYFELLATDWTPDAPNENDSNESAQPN